MKSFKERFMFSILCLLQILAHFTVAARRKRHFGDGLKSSHGFEMFSMVDYPHKILQKYSSDPVQGMIYSADDLTHTNGILTDRDVIEDVPSVNQIKMSDSFVTRGRNIQTDLQKVNSLVKRNHDLLPHADISAGREVKVLPTKKVVKVVPSEKNLIRKVKVQLKEIISKDQRKKSSKNRLIGFGSSRKNSKNSLQLNYITDAQDESLGGVYQAFKRTGQLPLQVKKPRLRVLHKVQKTVAVSRQKSKKGVAKEKISRSPPATRLKFRDVIKQRIKELAKEKKIGRPVRNPGLPSERDFFFFKDAFEYGARHLAKKFTSDEEPDTIALNEELRTAAPENNGFKWTNDFDKIRNEVKDNFAKELRLAPTNIESSEETKPTTIVITNEATNSMTTTPKQNVKTKTGSNLVYGHVKTAIGRSTRMGNLNVTTSIPYKQTTEPSSAELTAPTTKYEMTTSVAPIRKLATQSTNKKTHHVSSDASLMTTKPDTTVKIETATEQTTRTKERTTTPAITSTMTSISTRLSTVTTTASLPTKKVIVDSKRSNKLRLNNEKKKTRNRVIRVYKAESKPKPFKIPEWRLPPFYYRRPCPKKVDAMFKGHANKVYAIDGDLVYILNRYGVETGPLPVSFVWPRAETPIHDGYLSLRDHTTILFFKNKYATYANDRELIGSPTEITNLGLPSELAPIDAVSPWTGNGRTYYFKGNHYWKYNDYYRKLETGYPRRITRYWHGVPENVDTAFLAPNSYLYFVKRGLLYKMNYYRASVQHRYPKRLSESCYDFFM